MSRAPRCRRLPFGIVTFLAAVVAAAVPVAHATPPAPNPNIEMTQIYANEFREILEDRLGPIAGDVVVSEVDFPVGDETEGIARFADGQYYECGIPASESATPELGNIARMVFQCFIGAIAGPDNYSSLRQRRWIFDGAAAWGAVNVTNPAGARGWWANYLQSPETPLFERSFDAIGFYAHLSEVGVDTFAAMKQMFATGSDPAAFAVAGATSDTFMTTWASGLARQPDRGSPWDATGPYMPGDSAPITSTSVGSGTSTTLSAAPYTNSIYQLDVTADIVSLDASGYARLSDTAIDVPRLGQNRYCTRAEGCDTCPDGTPISNPPPALQPGALLALSGGSKATMVTIDGQDLPCEPEEDEGEAVTATVERPGGDGVLAGTVVELTSCNGVYGDWSGVFRLGGLSSGGFEVPFVEAPVAFLFAGTSGTQTATATVSGNVPTPAGDFAVTFDLVITVDGSTMSITGTGNVAGTVISLTDTMSGELASIPILPSTSC